MTNKISIEPHHPDMLFHHGVQCFVNQLNYDWSDRTGLLLTHQTSVTDMLGTIEMFKAIDARVERIAVMRVGEDDLFTLYLIENGEWVCRVRPRT